MAQFDYFGTWKDSCQILVEIFSIGTIKGLLDRSYDFPVPEFFHAADDQLYREARKTPQLFLFGTYSKYDVVFWQQDTGPKRGKFYPHWNRGGPLLKLSLACETETGQVGIGTLSYDREYWNPQNDTWEKPSNELKDAFVMIRSMMKRHLCRYQFKRSIWIGKDALGKVEHGDLKIAAFGIT